MGADQIIYSEKPNLDQPYLILGFEGWPNAAEVSSFALTQLIESTKARKFASLPYENFYQISSSRLVGVVKEGKLTELRFPGNHFYYLKNSPSADLILVPALSLARDAINQPHKIIETLQDAFGLSFG